MSSEHKYVRDKNSKAILNTDTKARDQYLAERRRVKRLENVEDRIETLEEKLDLILNKLSN